MSSPPPPEPPAPPSPPPGSRQSQKSTRKSLGATSPEVKEHSPATNPKYKNQENPLVQISNTPPTQNAAGAMSPATTSRLQNCFELKAKSGTQLKSTLPISTKNAPTPIAAGAISPATTPKSDQNCLKSKPNVKSFSWGTQVKSTLPMKNLKNPPSPIEAGAISPARGLMLIEGRKSETDIKKSYCDVLTTPPSQKLPDRLTFPPKSPVSRTSPPPKKLSAVELETRLLKAQEKAQAQAHQIKQIEACNAVTLPHGSLSATEFNNIFVKPIESGMEVILLIKDGRNSGFGFVSASDNEGLFVNLQPKVSQIIKFLKSYLCAEYGSDCGSGVPTKKIHSSVNLIGYFSELQLFQQDYFKYQSAYECYSVNRIMSSLGKVIGFGFLETSQNASAGQEVLYMTELRNLVNGIKEFIREQRRM